jgi:uncharacterized membrane protein
MSEGEARPPEAPRTDRLPALDLLRGLVMVVMALDHVREYFSGATFDPTDLSQTNAALFLTRWITHFCAPVFVFLAGTGAFLYGSRGRTKGELSRFLATRGLWLVFLELTWVRFSWSFDPNLLHAGVQVIWALGISMIVLAVLVYLPLPVITLLGLVMVATHNLLDPVEALRGGPPSLLWSLLHEPHRFDFSDAAWLRVRYPLIPWIGVMAVGHGLGSIMLLEREQRRRTVARLGLAVCALFVILRAINGYGDPQPWSPQYPGDVVGTSHYLTFDGPDRLLTVLSFVNCTKYPPSLDYLLMTLGPALLFLAWADREVPRLARPLVVFGRVPMFFYLLHIPLIHGVSSVMAYMRYGRSVPHDFTTPLPDDWGYGLPVVHLVWISVVLALYLPCKWFAGVKQRRRDPWLSYL